MPVAYDPTLLSSLSRDRLLAFIQASAALCADVEAMCSDPPVAPVVAADILRQSMLDLRDELVRIGAIRAPDGAGA